MPPLEEKRRVASGLRFQEEKEMKNLKYIAYAVPCCMACQGTADGIVFAAMTTAFLAFVLD